MAIQSQNNKPRDIPQVNGPDIARTGGRAKSSAPSPIHPGMASRTNTTLGAPPTGAAPDASSSNVTDPTLPGKHEPPVYVHPGMTSKQIAGASFNGEDILKEAMGGTPRHGIPEATTEPVRKP